jgi:PIN domain nuclease of toxin-antitoxin system
VVLLDTHAWIWLVDRPSRLSTEARALVEADEQLGVASISGWEVGMLHRRGRIGLDRPVADWVAQALGRPGIAEIPLTVPVALAAAMLPEDFPQDPADRLIYATARAQGAALVTKDARLRTFDPAGTIW